MTGEMTRAQLVDRVANRLARAALRGYDGAPLPDAEPTVYDHAALADELARAGFGAATVADRQRLRRIFGNIVHDGVSRR